MVNCQRCGAKLPETARFCSKCGAALSKTLKEEFTVSSENLIGKIRELLREGNVTRIVVRDDKGRTLLKIPAWAGIVGAVLAPWLAALGAIAAIATDCRISVIRRK